MILKLTKISLVLALLSTTALGQSQQTNELQLPKLLPPAPNASEDQAEFLGAVIFKHIFLRV